MQFHNRNVLSSILGHRTAVLSAAFRGSPQSPQTNAFILLENIQLSLLTI
jgi:hypothetical protein